MKPTLIALLSLVISTTITSAAPDAIFLLIGQSNMAGRANIEAQGLRQPEAPRRLLATRIVAG